MGVPVNGRRGSFAWSGGSMTLSDADGFRWAGVFQQDIRKVTPFGYDGEAFVDMLSDGQGEIEYYIASSTTDGGGTIGKPPIPSGSTGTLTLTAYSGQTYSFTALLSALATGANQTTNDPVTARYRWVFSAATPTEVIA